MGEGSGQNRAPTKQERPAIPVGGVADRDGRVARATHFIFVVQVEFFLFLVIDLANNKDL
jgi:hypothetical protein